MNQYDVFNGDADGICALHQLRLAEPQESILVTGVKRDVNLLEKIAGVRNARVTVLDISMASNRDDLNRLLETCTVFYADHHFAGDIPEHPRLTAHIDTSPDICTSLIVDRLLHGAYRLWAVAAAFGDNLHVAAVKAAEGSGVSESQLAMLRELGELLNYNGYGKTVADLHFSPQELYESIRLYTDPLEYYNKSAALSKLRAGFQSDMSRAAVGQVRLIEQAGRVYNFPGEPWARRVAGVFSNERARELPDLATALTVDNLDGTFLVSVRAPLHRKKGADELCRAFPTGGGRPAAAGINALPAGQMEDFIVSFARIFSCY